MNKSSYFKKFLCVGGIVLIFEVLFFLHIWADGYSFRNIDGYSILTIWAAVLMLIFLVFSVLGLLNVDSRIRNLHDAEKRVEEIEVEMTKLLHEFQLSAEKEKRNIVKKAEEEVVKIMDKSAVRQNNFDILTQIQNNPDPEFRIKRYTAFLNEKGNLEGVNLAFVHTQRGLAYQDLKRYDEAERDYEQAMNLIPEDFDAYLAMGTLYAKVKKQFEKAIEYYEKAVKLKPTLAVGYEMIGNAYSNLGNYDKAEEYYSRANDCGLELGQWYYNKALKIKQSGEDPNGSIAESFYKRCLKLNPFFMPAAINLAMIYRDRNENDKALKVLSSIVEGNFNEEFKNVVIQRGVCLNFANRPYDALNDFLWVKRYAPNNIQNLSNLALTCLKVGKFLDAEFYALRGLEQATMQNNHTCNSDFDNVLSVVSQIKRDMKRNVGNL